MTRKLFGLLAACALLAPAVSAKDFQEYSSADGKYKVQFPGKPKEQTQNAPGGIAMKIAGVEERTGAYMVMYSDMPIPEKEPDAKIQDRLEGAILGIVQNNGGTVMKKDRTTLNGKYPGRDFQAKITRPMAGMVRGKIVLVGRRLYQVMVLGTTEFAGSADATRFLNSFALTEARGVPPPPNPKSGQ